MESKIEMLEKSLDFTRGQLDALIDVIAAFIASSLDARAFLEGCESGISEKHEFLDRNQRFSRDYVDGFEHVAVNVARKVLDRQPPNADK